MLDPLTAISLAGNVVQFVDVIAKIISKTRELSLHGATQEAYNAEIVIQDLLRLSKKLKDGARAASAIPRTDDDKALEELCNGCINLSERVMKRLDKLKLGEGNRKRLAFVHALKGVWSQKELEVEEAQLAAYRSQLEFRVLTSFRDRFNLTAVSQSSGALEEASQRIISALAENSKLFESSIFEQTNTITQRHTEVKETTVKEHEKTRSILLKAVREVDTNRKPSGTAKLDHPINQKQELEARRRAEDHILRSLRISEHYNQIAEAHATTFQWIFKDPATEDRPWSNFAQWLKDGEGIYWINGKAGSGKSTLMSYIYDHQQTRELLRAWCGELPLTVASFFFWTSDATALKPYNGLPRSLLHQLLSQHRDLIPVVLPDQWQDEYVEPVEWRQDFQWISDILRRAFDALRTQDQTRVCLFIDGLDEYECDLDRTYAEIISFFTGLAESANIKICLSSRPWLVFEDAFRLSPSLKLQDLTFNDISGYVDDKINGHERMRELRQLHAESADNLTLEIVTKASGVFLWVKLAVNSLLDGFTNRDHISDLQRRLRELPADLESFYKHILINHIQPFYYEQSSQYFQIMQAANRPIFRTHEYSRPPPPPISLLILSLAEEKDSAGVLFPPKQLLSSDHVSYRCKEMAARLKSRCGGLLEVLEFGTKLIQYLHRSVRDFLDLPNTKLLLLSRTQKSFNADESLFKAWLLHLKYITPCKPLRTIHNHLEPISQLVDASLQHARLAMEVTGNSYVQPLDELDSIVMRRWQEEPQEIRTLRGELLDLRNLGAHWASFMRFRQPTEAGTKTNRDDFLALTLSFGLTGYVREKLKLNGDKMFRKPGRPLLDYIAYSDMTVGSELVSLLLEKGADPNERFSGCSTWQYMLELIENLRISEPWICADADHHRKELAATLRLLVEHGAHPNLLCTHIKNSHCPKEEAKYHAYFSTPATIFSPGGMFSDPGLVEVIKSRGGIEYLKVVSLQSTDWDDAEAEAMRIKPGVLQRLQTILRLQRSKKRPKKGNNNWRSRRKGQYRANRPR